RGPGWDGGGDARRSRGRLGRAPGWPDSAPASRRGVDAARRPPGAVLTSTAADHAVDGFAESAEHPADPVGGAAERGTVKGCGRPLRIDRQVDGRLADGAQLRFDPGRPLLTEARQVLVA